MGLENTRSSQVKKKRTNASVNSDHTNGIPDTRSDIFILTKGVQIPAPLEEESKTDAKEVREKYNEKPDHNWVQKILKNPHYDLVDNEGGGDCLFATIRDAFSLKSLNKRRLRKFVKSWQKRPPARCLPPTGSSTICTTMPLSTIRLESSSWQKVMWT